MFKKIVFVSCIFFCSLAMNCSDSMIASNNISKAAHQFEIFRRVVFYNGITDTYILTIEAYCSVTKDEQGKLAVTIRTEDGRFLKHYLGLSDNVTYFAEQIQPAKVSTSRYRVLFKPKAIVPYINIVN